MPKHQSAIAVRAWEIWIVLENTRAPHQPRVSLEDVRERLVEALIARKGHVREKYVPDYEVITNSPMMQQAA